jgi:D-alanine-D-alanine ligase-like ATP-grasp enzyme
LKIQYRGYWVSQTYKWVSIVHWVVYSLYFRTLTYFSVANPRIYLGGMLDDRKTDIYDLVPDKYLPLTKLYNPQRVDTVINDILENFDFPIIAKPNVGFRGYLVRRIDSIQELKSVIEEYKGKELLIQEFLTEAHEYSVMYYKIGHHEYGISSFVEKHMPNIIGDGISTIEALIDHINNPFLNIEWIKEKNNALLNRVMPKGEKFLVDHIGNHSRGCTFINLNEEISIEFKKNIHEFFKYVPGMHFCRLDVKSNSMDSILKGDFKLLEINGAKSEPVHIYDKRMSFKDVVRATKEHWGILFRIVQSDIGTMNIPSSLQGIRSYFSLKRMVS